MTEWKRTQGEIMRSLGAAQVAIERARMSAEKKRIQLKIDEDEEEEGWGSTSMAGWH